jgi:putative FmdB family regulatory protein
MPIYEYRCHHCHKEFSALILGPSDLSCLACEHCGGKDWERRVSRVFYHHSEKDRLAAYDPRKSPQGDSFFRDTRNIGLGAKKKAQQLGVDLGTSFEEKLEKLRTDPSTVVREGT